MIGFKFVLLPILAVGLGSYLSAQTLNVPDTIGTSTYAGKVGIGTTTPGAKLEVNAPSAEAIRIRGDSSYLAFFNTAGTRQGYLQGSSANVVLASDTGVLAFNTNGSERMRIDISGNTGIGTSSPASFGKLAVVGTVAAVSPGLGVTGSIAAEDGGGAYIASYGGAGSYLRFITTTSAAAYAERMRIDSSGNVGIGTPTPASPLHVYSSSVGGNSPMFLVSRAGAAGRFSVALDNGYTILESSDLNGVGTQGLQIRTRNAGSAINAFIVSAAGNVGIGTTNPGAYKLAVNGPIRAMEVIVDTGWSDYVFAPDYALAPLSEVEAHIKEHQHLPGIPSASEVAEHGISVGEMQAKLLAKIEEMTLYMIQQEKRTAILESENAELHREVESLKKTR